MIDEKKIEEADLTNIPKRIFIKDYQLIPCEVDGVSDARLNAKPFRTTNGKLVEYLCLDTLWHDASEEPKDKSKEILYKSNFYEGHGTTSSKYSVIYEKEPWRHTVSRLGVEKWLYIDDLQKGGE